MSNEQKLREALQAISHIDDTTNHTVDASAALDRIGQIARQALALPTALAISDTWGISRALVTLYAYECDGATDKALALITADHIPDAWEMVADHLPNAGKMIETAAPVCERDAFEHDLSKSPFEFDMDRWPDNAPVDWPGSYKQYHVQCAWDAWKARAALSAGDAVDAQRYRWLREQHWSNSDICCVNKPKQNVRLGGICPSGDLLDAAIDAAMRKGQL